MSVVVAIPAAPSALQTTTVRQFGRALIVALLAAGFGSLVYFIEKYAFGAEERFMQNPADVSMRALALAHFVVGWLFLFTSPKLRSRPAIGRLSLATISGVGLCALFAAFGGVRNPFLVVFFYGYFLVHEIRDEAQLFQSYGDGPSPSSENSTVLRSIGRSMSLLFMVALASMYLAYQAAVGKSNAIDRMNPMWIAVGMAGLVVLAAWSSLRTWQLGTMVHGDGRTFLSTYRPLFIVFAGILGLLAVGSPFGSTGFNMIILLHVTVWLVFVHYQLRKRPPAKTGNLWQWLRGTPAGFLTLHIGVAVVAMVLMAIRVHVWQKTGWWSEIFAAKNFCYWGLMHISMSFWAAR